MDYDPNNDTNSVINLLLIMNTDLSTNDQEKTPHYVNRNFILNMNDGPEG